jgi:peptide/nickel transport system substrate-binding protein
MNQLRIVQNQVRILPLEQTTEDADIHSIQMLISEPLVIRDKGRLMPGLADSWDVSPDGRTWSFHLREDARFSDGSPCTVEDVLHSFELLRASFDPFLMAGPYAPYFQRLVEQQVSRHELKIHSIEPNGDVPDILSEVFIRKQDASGNPVLGTGKYEVTEYENGKNVRLAARKDAGEVNYQQIEFRCVSQPAARHEALADGSADLALGLEQVEQLSRESEFSWGRISNTLSVPVFLNGFIAPFNQPEARLAINYAIDTHRIIRDVWDGLAIPAATVVSPYHFGYPASLQPLPYKPSLANELFSKIDMPGELTLRTPLVLPDRALQVCKNIVQQLADIGLKVLIDLVEDRVQYAHEVGVRKIGHMAIFDSSPNSTYRILREKVSSRAKWIWWQGVVDEQADSMISQAHETYEPYSRKKAYEGVLTYLNQAPVWLYLYHPINIYAYRENVTGVVMNHAGQLRFMAPDQLAIGW